MLNVFIALFSVLFLGGIATLIGWFVFNRKIAPKNRLKKSLNDQLAIIKVARLNVSGENSEETFQKEMIKMEKLLNFLARLGYVDSFLNKLIYGKPRVSFELAVPLDSRKISFYIAISKKYYPLLKKKIDDFFPGLDIEDVDDYTIFKPKNVTKGSYLTLKKHASFPIKTYSKIQIDSLGTLLKAFSELKKKGNGAAMQVVFQKSDTRWISRGEQIIEKMKREKGLIGAKGEENGLQDDDIIKQLKAKEVRHHFDVNIRLIVSAERQDRAEEILGKLESSFAQFDNSPLNSFIVNRGLKENAFKIASDFIFRNYQRDQRMIFDNKELATIVRFPFLNSDFDKINWFKSKATMPPGNVSPDGLLIGYNDQGEKKVDIKISESDRRNHFYIIGREGTGKSTLISEMLKQDVLSSGMCVIDPRGELVNNMISFIPPERRNDVVYLDLGELRSSISLNLMDCNYQSDKEKLFVAQEISSIFNKVYELRKNTGPAFSQYIRNAVLLVLDSPQLGVTLVEVLEVFKNPEFRNKKLNECKNEAVISFWKNEVIGRYGNISLEKVIPYIISKLESLLSDKIMRAVISQQKSSVDFRQLIDNDKIILVNLAENKVGRDNSKILGMMVVGEVLNILSNRAMSSEDDQKNFYLYIDEFQDFSTDSISDIILGHVKNPVCLVISHEFLSQLSEKNRQAIFSNIGSKCVFRVDPPDAVALAEQFSPVFGKNDLINNENYKCCVELMINGEVSEPFSMRTYPPSINETEGLKDDLGVKLES